MEQEEALQEKVALPEEALQEEALQEEVVLQEEGLPEEDNHLHSKPNQHNQHKQDRDTNLYAAQRSRNSKETEPTPRNS